MEEMDHKGREFYLQRISEMLSKMVAKLTDENRRGINGYNKVVENIMCGLLNRMYHYDFANTNTCGKANYPGIDLLDPVRRVGVQVTSQNTLGKVKDTLEKVQRHSECAPIAHLIMMIITFKDPTDGMRNQNDGRLFRGAEDIWNLNKLMVELENEQMYNIESVIEIANYLEKEVGSPASDPVTDPAQNPVPDSVHHEISKRTGSGNRNTKDVVWFVGVLALIVAVIAIWAGVRIPQIPQNNVEGTEDLLMWDAVTETLRKEKLTKTTIPLSDYESGLNVHGNLGSASDRSVSYSFTLCCANTATNPIAAFNAVRSEWFVSRNMSAEIFELPLTNDFDSQDPYAWKEYLDKIPEPQSEGWEWSETGVEAFLCDVLAVAGKCEDNLDFDDKFLSALHRSEEPVVHYSAADQCYYTYFIYYGDYTSHLICMYFHADKENSTQISDVEFQMLNMSYYYSGGLGFSGSQAEINNGCKAQVASLIMSIEHLLAGSSVFDSKIDKINSDSREMMIPLDYSVGDYQVAIMQNSYEGSAVGTDSVGDNVERCELITYRIHK